MFARDQYELLDFGAGRKLERFGPMILDRPSPPAAGARSEYPQLWDTAHARYVEATGGAVQRGHWVDLAPHPAEWSVNRGGLKFLLRCTPFGHIGLFPEHAAHWDWICDCVSQAQRPLDVLNLFAYTGGSTLAAAAAGASVVHVDAARNVVAWARRNAEVSGLGAAPIRWIVDDALGFIRREHRRGRKYDAVILDPPSYGHGPKGQPWKIESHLRELFAACREVLKEPTFILFTCHTPAIDAATASGLVAQMLPPLAAHGRIETGEMSLATATNRRLPAGVMARWRAS
jgi:23S rRNA (cytosine1962-C5)-methyltransferase